MPITPTEDDIGRRVIYAPTSKGATVADQMYGTLAKVWDGIPYIKYDWQPQRAPPIPESPSLLSWDGPAEEPQGAVEEHQADDDNDSTLIESAIYGLAAAAMSDDVPDPAQDSIEAGGGDFGGGGAEASWTDDTPSDPEPASDMSDSSSDSSSGGPDE